MVLQHGVQYQQLSRLITNRVRGHSNGQYLTDFHSLSFSMSSSASAPSSPLHPDLQNVFSEENKTRAIAALQKRSAGLKMVDMIGKVTRLRSAAVLIPLCFNLKGEPCFCYTLRSLKLSKHRGEICFPGGVSDPDDSDRIATALRETEEELSISSEGIEIWTVLHEMPTATMTMGVTPILGVLKEPLDVKTLKVNPDEVEEAFTIPLQHLCNKENWGHTQRIRGLFEVPTYKNMRVYHPPGDYPKPDGPSSSEEDENENKDKGVRLWGLTAILTHIVLEALLPNLYSRRLPQL